MLAVLLALLTFSASAYAQKEITGIVKDDRGEPLPGAYVVVKGTSTATMTDNSGTYSIKAKVGDILTFTYLGMTDQEIAIGEKSVVNVTLKPASTSIDEVVVVGYGQQKKTTLTGSVSQISGEDLIKAPSTNVSSLLGGRVSGIASVQESGQPGADQASITIRGSRYGVTYIVDGMPRSLDEVDPNDIATISVLKDASAAAVYGLTSAGGVIIITTKKGDMGKNTVNYNGSYGVSVNANFPKFMNAEQFAWYYNKACEMDGYSTVFTQEEVNLMTNGDDSDGWGDTDWIDEVFGIGQNQKHNISVQGGTEKMRYFASIGYLGQQGNIKNYLYDKYNVRTNIESQINNSLKVSLGISGQADKTSQPGFSSGGSESDDTWMSIARQTIASLPYLPMTYDGLPVASVNNYGQGVSPIAATEESGYNRTQSYDLQTNIEIEYKPQSIKGLTAKIVGSCDHGYTTSKILATPYYVNLASLPTDGTTNMVYTKTLDVRGTSYNTLGEGLSQYTQMIGNASMEYVTTIAEDHNLDVMGLAEIRQYQYNGFAAYGKELPFAELPELSFATPADSPISGYSGKTRSIGFVGRIRYNYANRYMLEASGRVDGSYKFAGDTPSNRWGFFPAISAGWRISEENFIKDNFAAINNLKLRASFGELGSDSVSEYSFLNQYSFTTPLYLGNERYNAMYTSGLANTNLTWERIRSYNVGIDLGLWKDMLTFSIDGFYNYNYDILQYMGGSYPPSMGGYYPSYENYSSTDTKGVDITIGHKNTIGTGKNAFTYSANLNVSYAYSRWLKYPDSVNTPEYQCLTGKEMGIMLGWISDGLYQSEEEIDNSAWPFGQRPRVGDIKYEDLNGDGVIEYADKAFVGRTNRPELTAGLNLNASWRGFDLSMLITGAALFDISLTGTYYNGNDDNTIFTETFKEGGNSPLYLVENAWRPDNTDGTYPRLTMNSPTNNNGLACTFWFRDGKYIRLKTLQLGYTIPKELTGIIGSSNSRIYVEGSNLFTISGLPQGIDPESPGVNNGYYPQQRTFMVGVSVTF
ncbi:MAG: TonB-dependent receptor [Bacteroidales bacterium]|nr:TonB-dependent receptor [Bacteroidales bacterium]